MNVYETVWVDHLHHSVIIVLVALCTSSAMNVYSENGMVKWAKALAVMPGGWMFVYETVRVDSLHHAVIID